MVMGVLELLTLDSRADASQIAQDFIDRIKSVVSLEYHGSGSMAEEYILQ
jgi:hypothetical protein